jgi:hypothetical protein
VDADLDTLATALYVKTDDLLKAFPERVPWRPRVGFTPKISDAEMVTLAVMQALRAPESPPDAPLRRGGRTSVDRRECLSRLPVVGQVDLREWADRIGRRCDVEIHHLPPWSSRSLTAARPSSPLQPVTATCAFTSARS